MILNSKLNIEIIKIVIDSIIESKKIPPYKSSLIFEEPEFIFLKLMLNKKYYGIYLKQNKQQNTYSLKTVEDKIIFKNKTFKEIKGIYNLSKL